MTKPGSLTLLSQDLLFRSKVEAIASRFGVAVSPATEAADLMLVDLNSEPESGIAGIAESRAGGREVPIIGFCSHGADEVRIQAMAAGASQVINNGALERTLTQLLSDPA